MSSPDVHAVLQAGDTETLYRRAGTGPSVLLIPAGVLADPLGGALFERLAARYRVVSPRVPAGLSAAALAAWLGEVLEGLGLVQPVLVVDAALATAPLDAAAFAGIVAVAGAAEADADALIAAVAAHLTAG